MRRLRSAHDEMASRDARARREIQREGRAWRVNEPPTSTSRSRRRSTAHALLAVCQAIRWPGKSAAEKPQAARNSSTPTSAAALRGSPRGSAGPGSPGAPVCQPGPAAALRKAVHAAVCCQTVFCLLRCRAARGPQQCGYVPTRALHPPAAPLLGAEKGKRALNAPCAAAVSRHAWPRNPLGRSARAGRARASRGQTPLLRPPRHCPPCCARAGSC